MNQCLIKFIDGIFLQNIYVLQKNQNTQYYTIIGDKLRFLFTVIN